jgi:hypothetical protein
MKRTMWNKRKTFLTGVSLWVIAIAAYHLPKYLMLMQIDYPAMRAALDAASPLRVRVIETFRCQGWLFRIIGCLESDVCKNSGARNCKEHSRGEHGGQ